MRDSRIHSVRFHYGDRQTAEMEKENYIMKPLILLTGGTGAAANGTPTWALNHHVSATLGYLPEVTYIHLLQSQGIIQHHHGTVLSQHQARDRETSKLYEAAAI